MNPNNSREDPADEARVLVLAHCLLDQATRWRQNKAFKASGPVNEVFEILMRHKIGAIQLPCPEFTFCGNPRPPRTKDEYEDMPGFREHCERLAEVAAANLKTMMTIGSKPRIRVLAIVGVKRSPTCGVNCAPRRVGERPCYAEEKGLFFEILEKKMRELGLEAPFVEIDFHEPADFCEWLDEFLCKNF